MRYQNNRNQLFELPYLASYQLGSGFPRDRRFCDFSLFFDQSWALSEVRTDLFCQPLYLETRPDALHDSRIPQIFPPSPGPEREQLEQDCRGPDTFTA